MIVFLKPNLLLSFYDKEPPLRAALYHVPRIQNLSAAKAEEMKDFLSGGILFAGDHVCGQQHHRHYAQQGERDLRPGERRLPEGSDRHDPGIASDAGL